MSCSPEMVIDNLNIENNIKAVETTRIILWKITFFIKKLPTAYINLQKFAEGIQMSRLWF